MVTKLDRKCSIPESQEEDTVRTCFRQLARNNKEKIGQPIPTSKRALGGFEYFMWKAHQMGCGLMYFIAELQGSTLRNSEIIQQAALLCMKRHPQLRARLRPGGYLEEISFQEYPFPIHVPFIRDKSPLEFTEEEVLRTSIAHGRDVLWKLYLLDHREGRKQYLIALVHHTILDGESVVLFLKEILENVEKIQERTPFFNSKASAGSVWSTLLEEIEPLTLQQSQDELFVRLLRQKTESSDGLYGTIAYTLKRLRWLLQRPTTPEAEKQTRSIEHRQIRIHAATLSEVDSLKLLQSCQREKTTLTAVIAVAVIQEIRSHMKDEPKSVALKVETMVNLRRFLMAQDASFAERLQLLAAPIDMVIPVTKVHDEDEMWRQARAYKEELTQAIQAGQWKKQIEGFQTFRRFNDGVYRMLAQSLGGPSQGRVKATAISNLGNLDETFLGKKKKNQKAFSLSISNLIWGITEYGMGHYVFVAISSRGGRIHLNITCPAPIISEERGRKILGGILNRLRVASSLK